MSVSLLSGTVEQQETTVFLRSDRCSRARHVKCHEKLPFCLNCTATGRKCDGYEITVAPGQHSVVPTLELLHQYTTKSSPWNDSLVNMASTLGLPPDQQNRRFFHSFLHGCLPSLAEAMDSEFWQKDILRVSSSPAVQYTCVALGAAYEQRLARDTNHWGFACSSHGQRLDLLSSLRYNTAIRVLRDRIQQSQKSLEAQKEIMAACLLFVFMEILRGDDVAAITHLDGAIKMCTFLMAGGDALADTGDNSTSSEMNSELERLTKTFLRLDIQSVLYMGSRTPWYPDGISVSFRTFEDVPATFETFLDARDNLYAHVANAMNFVTPPYGADFCFPGFSPHPARGFDIYTIFHGSTYRDFHVQNASTQRRYNTRILSRWKSAFLAFLQRDLFKTPEALAGCALLWLTYLTMRIKLAVSYMEDECCYDEQLPMFKKIVEQVETYQKYASHSLSPSPTAEEQGSSTMPRLKPKKTAFNVYSGIGYPLYYTALKCRHRPLRQRALKILQTTDTEGLWDAKMLTSIAEFVSLVEDPPDLHTELEDGQHFGGTRRKQNPLSLIKYRQSQ